LIVVVDSGSPFPRVELGNVHIAESLLFDKIKAFPVHLIRFSRKAYDDVSGVLQVANGVVEVVHDLIEFLHSVLPIHAVEHFIAAWLHRDVQLLEALGVVQHFADALELVEHLGRIAVADPQHGLLCTVCCETLEYVSAQLHNVGVDVQPLRTSVFTHQPEFQHAPFEAVIDSFYDLVHGVRFEVASSVSDFAVSART